MDTGEKPVEGWIEVQAATSFVVPLFVEGLAAVVTIGGRRVKERREGAVCEGVIRIGGIGGKAVTIEQTPRSETGRRVVGEMISACRKARR